MTTTTHHCSIYNLNPGELTMHDDKWACLSHFHPQFNLKIRLISLHKSTNLNTIITKGKIIILTICVNSITGDTCKSMKWNKNHNLLKKEKEEANVKWPMHLHGR